MTQPLSIGEMQQTNGELPRNERNMSLDMLRGIAALLVLIRHFPKNPRQASGPFEMVIGWLNEVGWVGVDLFFVLSGFLISTLIYKEYDSTKSFAAGRFLIRRSFKIWPSYYFAFLGAAALQLIVAHWRQDSERIETIYHSSVINSLFLQTYIKCEMWPHSWSIAVEEHFYTAFAMIALLIASTAKWRGKETGSLVFQVCIPIFIVVSISAFLFRWDASYPIYRWQSVYYKTHMRADGLAFGVLIGYLHWYHKQRIPKLLTSWPVLAFAWGVALSFPILWTLKEGSVCGVIGPTVLYLSFGAIVLAAGLRPDGYAHRNQVWQRARTGLGWIGFYSYTIYIAHSVLFGLPGFESTRQHLLQLVAVYASDTLVIWFDRIWFLGWSVFLGVLLSICVEQPFLKLRSRVAPRRSATCSH